VYDRPFVLVLLRVLGMKRRNPGECGSGFGFGEIFVAFQADGDPNFRLFMAGGGGRILRMIGSDGGSDDAQNVAAAAYRHVFAKSDF
jgi:hypothetical protein